MNFEKNFSSFGMSFVLSANVKNLFNNKNSSIVNPVTGRAYEYSDPTPIGWNDPLFPDLQAPVSPYPYNPARYLAGRNLILGLTIRF
jgi:hypothetical protein